MAMARIMCWQEVFGGVGGGETNDPPILSLQHREEGEYR
jgi:hypothetical protein